MWNSWLPPCAGNTETCSANGGGQYRPSSFNPSLKWLPDHKEAPNPKFNWNSHVRISAKVPETPAFFCFLISNTLEAEAVSSSFAFDGWKWFDTALIGQKYLRNHMLQVCSMFQEWITQYPTSFLLVNSLFESQDKYSKMQWKDQSLVTFS